MAEKENYDGEAVGPIGPTALRILDVSSLAERAFQVLRREILQRVHLPGARLEIHALAQAMGVSTAPLRDAVRRLEADGLVRVHPRHGTFVTDASAEDVSEVYEVRRCIETAAAGKAVATLDDHDYAAIEDVLHRFERLLEDRPAVDYDRFIELDIEFHRLIVVAARNGRLTRFYDELQTHNQIARAKYSGGPDRGWQTVREHRAILSALRTRDPRLAEEAVATHLDAALADLLAHLESMTAVRTAVGGRSA